MDRVINSCEHDSIQRNNIYSPTINNVQDWLKRTKEIARQVFIKEYKNYVL
jgi:hypothetical protein